MESALFLLVLLVAARVCGEASERIGLPASVGEVLAGVMVAFALLRLEPLMPALSAAANGPHARLVADIGVFALMLLAGIEMKPGELMANSRAAAVVAAGGMVLPLAAGTGLAFLFLPESPLKPVQAAFVGVALSTTAVPATTRVLVDLGLLRSRLGETIVAAAVIDDVFGLVILAALIGILGGGPPDAVALALLVAKVVGFFVVTGLLGVHVYPHVSRRMREMEAAGLELSALVAAALAYGVLAEALDLHWILGAFMAGLFFEESRVGPACHEEVRRIVLGITVGVFGPLFFATIGMSVDLAAVGAIPVFLALLVALALAGKVVGAGLPARAFGFSARESLAIGVGMSSRGVVGLVVASIALDAGIFQSGVPDDVVLPNLFSAVVLTSVVTTLLAPLLLRPLLRGGGNVS
jgi:Kef-type K+ transport system membrane component KefB